MNELVTYTTPGLDALSESSGWMTILVVLLVGCALAAIGCGWRERRLVPRGWGWLLTLRLAAIAAAGLLLLGPQRRALIERERPSRVVVLTDQSASMLLPADPGTQEENPRRAPASEAVDRLAEMLEADHLVRRAAFDVVVRYDEGDGGGDSAAGVSTRLGDAISRVLEDHAGAPLAAIVLASDGGWNGGDPPEAAAARAAARGVPVHALGVGPREAPPNAGLRDLATPTRAAVGDPFRAAVAVTASGSARPRRVAITARPLDGEGSPGEVVLEAKLEIGPDGSASTDDLRLDTPGRYELTAELLLEGPDADASDNRKTTLLELVDEPARVLLAAGGPSRDYRFLRDQLFRDDQFTCDVLLQTATGAVTQDAGRVLAALPADAAGWDAYDALVVVDFDWRQSDDETLEALGEWVASGGGGVVFASAGVNTPGCVRAGLAPTLKRLLPVTLRDDPLAAYASLGAARDPRRVSLTPAGEGVDFLTPPRAAGESDLGWDRFTGFYASPLPAEAKPGAAVLATLGEAPLFVEQAYGAGRVSYLASAETWRLRRVSPDWFTALHTGLLRHVTRGRLLGGEAEGTLLFDRDRYQVGDPVTLRYVSRSAEGAGDARPLTARFAWDDSDSTEVALLPVADQEGANAATLVAERSGRMVASLVTPGGRRLSATASAALPSLESETLVQNVATLRGVAEATGGLYVDLSEGDPSSALQGIAARTPSLAETVTELGPPDEQFALRVARGTLAVMIGALVVEWLLRRMWRLA